MYEMMYSSPTFHKPNENLRDAYHPLFDKYHVDLVLQAHNHNYQRSFPISYSEKQPSKPIITDRNEEQYTDPKGIVFVVTGTAGADQYNFTGQAPYIERQFQRFGFLDIRIANNGTTMMVTFYENREITDKDHFIINKSNQLSNNKND
jgi:hypothetical protein